MVFSSARMAQKQVVPVKGIEIRLRCIAIIASPYRICATIAFQNANVMQCVASFSLIFSSKLMSSWLQAAVGWGYGLFNGHFHETRVDRWKNDLKILEELIKISQRLAQLIFKATQLPVNDLIYFLFFFAQQLNEPILHLSGGKSTGHKVKKVKKWTNANRNPNRVPTPVTTIITAFMQSSPLMHKFA